MATTVDGALAAWRAGYVAEAERLTRALLAGDSRHPDALRLLQEILTASDRLAEALAVARRVCALAPADGAALRRCAELHRRSGDAGAAIAQLELALRLEPDNLRTLNNLGQLYTSENRDEEALQLLLRAVSLDPDYAAAHANLGLAYAKTGRLDRAIDACQRAVTLAPRLAEAWLNLAGIYQRSTQPAAALDCYERAAALRAPDGYTLVCRGEVELALGRGGAALERFEAALRAAPGLGAAHLGRVHALLALHRPADALTAVDALLSLPQPTAGGRGLRATALLALERFAEAAEEARAALAADPDDVQGYVTLGFAQLHDKFPAAARTAFEAAVQRAPALAKAHAGLAQSLEALGRGLAAVDVYETAMQLDPGDTGVALQYGLLVLRLGSGASALAAFDRILAMAPGNAEARQARALTLVALGWHDQALAAFDALEQDGLSMKFMRGYRFGMQLACCDWRDYAAQSQEITTRVAAGDAVVVPLTFVACCDSPPAQLDCARIYAAPACRLPAPDPELRARSSGKRLRIAYLSFDFRAHPVAQLAVGVLEAHDRARFEIYGLCAALDDGSDLRRRVAASFEHFEDVSALSDEALALHVAELGIDVLVDLGGHTLGSRTAALAYRPAPVQVSWLGYPGTLGTDYVDYIVADRHVIPESERAYYAEQVIYMPDSYLPGDTIRPRPPPPERAAAGLPDDALVLCSFNAAFKFNPALFAVWMDLLRTHPKAILWLREGPVGMRQNLAAAAAAHGVDPVRLVYAPRVSTTEDHLARLSLADIFVDTSPYNAHTTASDALSAGVPVVTLRGRSFASRVATSLLHTVGLGHLSVATPGDYARLIHDLVAAPTQIRALKEHLARVIPAASLFDPQRYCGHLEAAWIEVHSRQQQGEPPRPLDIALLR